MLKRSFDEILHWVTRRRSGKIYLPVFLEAEKQNIIDSIIIMSSINLWWSHESLKNFSFWTSSVLTTVPLCSLSSRSGLSPCGGKGRLNPQLCDLQTFWTFIFEAVPSSPCHRNYFIDLIFEKRLKFISNHKTLLVSGKCKSHSGSCNDWARGRVTFVERLRRRQSFNKTTVYCANSVLLKQHHQSPTP